MTRSILKSLLKPEAYLEPVANVEMLQTHASWLFITDNHVYKIKKPVNFGLIDFSSIDRRRFYCNEEVKYNRRLCPDMYEGVAELRQTSSGFGFCGTGQIIDYAVKMKRLPTDRMLNRLIKDNTVSVSGIRSVARVIADFHRSAPTSPIIAGYGSIEQILNAWNENLEQINSSKNLNFPMAEYENIKKWVTSFADRNAALFEKRITNGFIRECNGNIHLKNICLTNGSIYIFNCIEFSSRLRYCDTASDIAFLLMDLDFHGRRDLSEEALASYHESSGDEDIVALIDFYKIYRAVAYGKTLGMEEPNANMDCSASSTATLKAVNYFRLARGYIEKNRLPQTLFITCGLRDCGKTTLANQLAFELGIFSFNLDSIRKKMNETSTPLSGGPLSEEELHAQWSNETIYGELLRLAELEILAGRSVILNASFARKSDRTSFANMAQHYGARFLIIHVSYAEAINRHILHASAASDHTTLNGKPELLTDQHQTFEPPETGEGIIVPIGSMGAPENLTNMIYNKLSDYTAKDLV